MNSEDSIGIIELGNKSLKCLIFKINNDNNSEILSVTTTATDGIYNDVVVNLKKASDVSDIQVSGKKKVTNDDFCLNCKPSLGNYKNNPNIVVVLSGYPFAYYDKLRDSYDGLVIEIMNQLIRDLELKPNITYLTVKDKGFECFID